MTTTTMTAWGLPVTYLADRLLEDAMTTARQCRRHQAPRGGQARRGTAAAIRAAREARRDLLAGRTKQGQDAYRRGRDMQLVAMCDLERLGARYTWQPID